MLRALFTRKPDWTVFTAACFLSIVLMLLPGGAQVRVAWFLQHIVLAPVDASVAAVESFVSVHWENQKLRQRLAELRIETDALRSEREENLRLRGLLDLRGEAPHDLVAARVIGRSLDRLGGSLTLDRGADDGIGPDAVVLTPEGLVGRVERATPRWSRVLTVLHRDCAVAVRLTRSRVQGVVQWEYGERPLLDLLYVSSQEDVKPGDVVATSGMGGIFPEGIRVGTVSRVALADDRLMKRVTIEPSVSFQRLSEVLVFLPGGRGVFPRDAYAPPPAADTTGAAPDSAATAAAPPRAVGAAP
jgi:rod shape-determining protein MreC